MKLYGYWRSSATWRVRIALELKGVDYTYVPVNLLEAEHLQPEHLARNPLGQIPVLELMDGSRLVQSVAILTYLEQRFPDVPLLPFEPVARAQVLGLVEAINSGVQPLQNLSVLKRIEALGADRLAWGREVVERGLAGFQTLTEPHRGAFCFGDEVTLADVLLVPQLYNARRFGCDLEPLAPLVEIEARCAALDAFRAAHPDAQSDCPNP